jgi:uncharacterized protein YciI
MLFALTAILKRHEEPAIAALADAFNEHLSQPFRRVRLAGVLRDADRRRIGFMVVLEAESYAAAEAYLHESPLFRAGAYSRVEVAEYELEVGRLD